MTAFGENTIFAPIAELLASETASLAITAATIALWYIVWRKIEPRLPDWLTRLVLGSATAPTYDAQKD